MSEVYPLRASGEYAGTYCIVNGCPSYARVVLSVMGEPGTAKAVCARHLPVMVRTLLLTARKALVVQAVPGNWGRELVVTPDGEIGRTTLSGG